MAPETKPLPEQEPSAEERATSYRRTELSIECEQFTVHYQPGVSYAGMCPQCGREVLMLTAEAAAVTVGVGRRAIYRWVEQAAVHYQETAAGEVFLCFVSLQLLRSPVSPTPRLPTPAGAPDSVQPVNNTIPRKERGKP